MRSRRLLAVVASLRGGGAERVLAAVASAAAEAGHDVTVLTLFPRYLDDYPLHASCRRLSIDSGRNTSNLMQAATDNLSRVARLRRAIVELSPDVVLSFMDTTNVLSLLASAGLGVRVVVSERVDPRSHQLSLPWRWLRRLTYGFADAVVVQTESVASGWARPLLGHARVHVIPNPLVLRPEAADERSPGGHLLAVGRLDPQKGFDTLLRAYARAVANGLAEPLVIVGEGPSRGTLETLVAELGLADRVSLPGRSERIEEWYRSARAFVLSSRYEGFPNSLLEALAFGLPSVATDCPSGPAELLAGGAGVLVPVDDVDRLASALVTVCTDHDTRTKLAARARQAASRYAMSNVRDRWMQVLHLDSEETGLATGPFPPPTAISDPSGGARQLVRYPHHTQLTLDRRESPC